MLSRFLPSSRASAFDLIVVLALVLGGAVYHWDFNHWAIGLVGGEPYGDAHFWWDGAVRVSDGQFTGHPGKGYRPGYFVLTGLSLTVIGPDFATFHKFLLANFLAVAGLFYFAVRQPLGRAAAAASAALLVFNPFTAEWIATTTTDGLGIVLHLASLSCLLVAIQRDLSRRWLAGFGVLFAMANLTRPLMMPFIGVEILVLLLMPSRPWRDRWLAVLTTAITFAVPTVLWMGVQARWVGEWTVSNNDAGALYAASDPAIQVWRPEMYDLVKASARQRYKTDNVTGAQINQEFKRLALKNYVRHWRFHVDRALPHVWTVASFSPKVATRGTDTLRTWMLTSLAAVLALTVLTRGFVMRAGLLAALGGAVWLSPHLATLLTLAGCGLALMPRPGRAAHLGLFLLACYWLVGVLALFLTGGTWIQQGGTHVNALGYRVGFQFFFAGDVLACVLLFRLTRLNLPAEADVAAAGVRGWVTQTLTARLAPASVLLGVLGLLLLLTDASVLALGSGKVALRRHQQVRSRKNPIPFPDATPITKFYRRMPHFNETGELIEANDPSTLRTLLCPNRSERREGPDVLVSGKTGWAVWEMTGQQRTQVYFHAQNHIRGVVPTGCDHVDLPFAGRSPEWRRRQGAFILRGTVDRPPAHNLPYYLNAPSVRAFVPLDPSGTGYDLEEAVWFPLTRYASQLEAAGDLDCPSGTITWLPDSGPAKFQRRIRLVPTKPTGDEPYGVTIKLDRAVGKRSLRLGWHPVEASSEAELRVLVSRTGSSVQGELSPVVRTENGLMVVAIDCTSTEMTALEFSFRRAPAGVLLYELNLTADDFRP
jgi:4-amino-4-deoxy-L-arabinose transferase-like glycosyltransferase